MVVQIKNVFLGILLACVVGHAQKEQRANDLLTSLIQYYKDFDDITVHFTYQEKLKNSVSTNSEITGSLTMKDSLFIVTIPGLEMRSDGIHVYTITPEIQEVYRSPISESEQIPFHLLNLLSYLQSHFETQSDITEHRLNRKINYIKLTPLDTLDSIESILLGMDPITNELLTLVIESTDNIKTSMFFNHYVYNQGLSSDFFAFNPNKFSDYTIIE